MTKSKIDVGPLYTCSEGFKWPVKETKCWDDVSNRLRWQRRHSPSIKTWLNAAAYREPVARFLLRYGRTLKPAPVQLYKEEGGGHCYAFSYMMMRHNMDNHGRTPFKYMEGLALTPIQPAQLHAWNIMAGGVFDMTWANPHSVKYCGIEIGHDLISFVGVVKPRSNDIALLMNFEQMWPYLDNYCLDRERRRRKTTVRA